MRNKQHEAQPKVSVIIPAFNAEAFLAEAVGSVLAQTYRNIEIIVVNDGSSDGTGAVALSFGQRIIYVEQSNSGPARARNRGIELSTGVFVAFLDADDLWVATKIEEQIRFLQGHPEVALVYAQMVNFRQGTEIEEAPFPTNVHSGWLFDQLLTQNSIPLPSVLVRSQVLRAVGGFEEGLRTAEDTNLYLKISRRHQIAGMARPLLWRRLHGSNLSRRNDVEVGTLDNLDRISSIFPEKNPLRHGPMREAYRLRGVALLRDLFCASEYNRARSVVRKLRSVGVADSSLLQYHALLVFPDCVLNATKNLRRWSRKFVRRGFASSRIMV